MKTTPKHKRVAEQLTSLFENGTIEFQYGYAQNLKDGRGITCGRAGFCTGTGDAIQVVEQYTANKPGNPLERFLPELTRLNKLKTETDDVRGLVGFIRAWQKEAGKPAFREAQDAVTDKLYWEPSQRHANRIGLVTPLARAFMFDTIIQHGDGDDQDGLTALLVRANAAVGGTPATGVPETEWLANLIRVRRADLIYCSDPTSRSVWAESYGRCDTFAAIAASMNYDLVTPFWAKLDGHRHMIP